jgi:hypothetical protein
VVSFKQTNWDEQLSVAELAVNNAVSASTGYTPFYLVYGHNVRLPIDAAFGPLLKPSSLKDNPTATQQIESWRTALKEATSNILKANQRSARHVDQHRRDVHYEVGELVLLSTVNLKLLGDAKRARKLTAPFVGPFAIKRVINSNAYELSLPPTLKIHPVVNISQLKKYRLSDELLFPSRAKPINRPPPVTDGVDGSGGPEWEVEKILDKRLYHNSLQYLVLWKGYPIHEATWEPRENVEDTAKECLAEFESGRIHCIELLSNRIGDGVDLTRYGIEPNPGPNGPRTHKRPRSTSPAPTPGPSQSLGLDLSQSSIAQSLGLGSSTESASSSSTLVMSSSSASASQAITNSSSSARVAARFSSSTVGGVEL